MLADLYRKALIPFFQPHYYAPNSIFCFLRIGITKARFFVSCFIFLLQVTSFFDSPKSLSNEEEINVLRLAMYKDIRTFQFKEECLGYENEATKRESSFDFELQNKGDTVDRNERGTKET